MIAATTTCLAMALGVVAIACERHVSAAKARAKGEALFHGTAALPGQLAGHATPLPPVATRCSNCHEELAASPRRAVSASVPAPNIDATAASRSYAGSLDRGSLEVARARRGGPPSRFDAARLCTLLRTGADPAQVLIPPTMPRYAASDAQCADLWAYLVTR